MDTMTKTRSKQLILIILVLLNTGVAMWNAYTGAYHLVPINGIAIIFCLYACIIINPKQPPKTEVKVIP